MINKKFESYKLEREIKRSGISCIFKRKKKNYFGEPVEGLEDVCEIFGLYHEQNSRIQLTTGDSTQTRTKKIPMILCLHEDSLKLKPEDILFLNDKTFKVTGVVNIQEWNIISDISLEVIDYVIQT